DDSTSMGIVKELHTDGQRLYAVTRNGLYVSDEDGRSHTWRLTDSPVRIDTITIDQNHVYAVTYSSGMFRSDDRGATWKPINNGIPVEVRDGGGRRYPIIRHIFVMRSGTVIALGLGKGSWTSTDRGETWHSVIDEWVAIPPQTFRNENKQPRGIQIPMVSLDWMIEFDGDLLAHKTGNSFYLSRDNGATWEYSFLHFNRPNDWAVLNNRLYIGGSHGLTRFSQPWDNIIYGRYDVLPDGLPDGEVVKITLPITTLAVHRNILFAVNSEGVYMFDETTDTSIPVGLHGFRVTSLLSHGSRLYAVVEKPAADSPPWHPAGIYEGVMTPRVQPNGKAAAIWGRVKHGLARKFGRRKQ
ncbi:MAG: hypothetical protein OXI86_02940, partial [Candidatus Poribacteria bacterium]|nr:hypothetical protein [Candidatus Poribacteria bacterium]